MRTQTGPLRLATPALVALAAILPAACGDGGEQHAPQAVAGAAQPRPEPGAKAAAPGVPTTEGGDNSIQTWGVEASGAERARLTAIARAFYDARAAAEWNRACARLAAEQRRASERLAGRNRCGAALARLAQGIPARAFAEEAEIDAVLSLRVGGGHAFLIYARPGGKVFATALRREGNAWKVFSVGPTALG